MSMELVSKQLALTGRLKPEARLGLAISEFAQALDSERRKEFRSMQTTQDAQISGRDIIRMTEEINQEGARRHRSWRPHGTKVGGFLTRIQNFATIGDVLVGGSQNLIATGIWSAVRLSLTIATNYLSYFEKLSTLFMRLGTSWTLHKDFAQLFPASEVLQAYFCEYLVSLMKLCNKAVVFCQKNARAQLLSSFGSSFDSEFGPVQKELDQWGCLIEQQTHILATKIATDAQNDRFQDLKQRILRRLSPYQSDYETRWRRQRKKGTCEWVFNTQALKDWKSMRKSATLSVHGKLGSGKTVSMANIVAQMNLDQPCAYVFCATQELTSLEATNILGSIAHNLLDNLLEEDTAREKLEQNDTTKAFDPETIIDFLLSLLPEEKRYIIIADGLESCADAEISDVLFGLHRLIQNRVVLLCYSSRSGSRFQNVANQHLAPEFSVSHDNLNHDTELVAYITEEVIRRNATRHLSLDLEELVKKQLIAGSQGMYLWVSLQLDTIFPANPKVVNTDDQVLNLINHLPKDLPEAYEQALKRIPDRQYEGKIMKLVLSAVSPLNLDEIRIALCVVLGELDWHPGKMAKDGTQLISLCGGSLLDLDEEDGKVRFIHHSVIQHLLSPAATEITIPYHFTIEDAENFTGATCVTYLNLTHFDTKITLTRNLQTGDVLNNVVGTTRKSLPGVSLLVGHIKSWGHRRARASHVDIGHIIAQIQATRVQENTDPHCFEHYASNNWIHHTRFFIQGNRDCEKSWGHWLRLLHGPGAALKPPDLNLDGDTFPTLLWAVEQSHGALFRILLTEISLRRREVAEIIHALDSNKSIHGEHLGDILAQFLQSLPTHHLPFLATITLLLDLGANPNTRHHASDAEPLKVLAQMICPLSDDGKQELIRAVFGHPTVLKLREESTLLEIIEELKQEGEIYAVREILALHPDVGFEYKKKEAKRRLTPQSPTTHNTTRVGMSVQTEATAIEKALGDERLKDVENLALDRINDPTSSGTTLLWKAIEDMRDVWVYHLLRLGADPNAGPFRMQLHPDSPDFAAKFYPLEAALSMRRTRVCIELLLHGANILLCRSPMRLAQETKNWIMIARLREKEKPVCSSESRAPDRTALATACRMLSHDGSSEPPGFPRPWRSNFTTWGWSKEVRTIIRRLLLEEKPEYIKVQDEDGRTALHYLLEATDTATHDFTCLVDSLLWRGADPNLPDHHGETALWLAIQNSAPIDSVIQRLLKAGADPNLARPLHNCSILEEALCAYQGTKQDLMRLLKLLLQAGADPRNPLTLASPDPSLIRSASTRGVESLTADLWEYGQKWRSQGTPLSII